MTSVYVGKDDNKSLGEGVTGGVIAAPPWKEFMTYAISILSLESKFEAPPAKINVSLTGICRSSGFLAASGCPTVLLYLKRGSAPTTKCPEHGGKGSISDLKAPILITIAQDAEIIRGLEEGFENDLLARDNETRVIAARQNSITGSVQGNSVVPDAPTLMARDTEDNYNAKVQDRYEKLLEEYGIGY